MIGPEMQTYVYPHIDDLLIVTSTFNKHLKRFEKVFKEIKQPNLVSNEKKKIMPIGNKMRRLYCKQFWLASPQRKPSANR